MNIIRILREKVDTSSALATRGVVFFLNPYTYLMLRETPCLLEKASRIYIDGEWLRKFMSWFAVKNVKRISFDNTSLAPFVFKDAVEKSKKVAIVGSTEEVNRLFCSYLKKTYPGIDIVYDRNGYFESQEEFADCHVEIINAKAEVVVVGMGAVKQEMFALELVEKGFDGVVYTCGGFMHQTSKSGHDYYPKFYDKLNIRFLYRMIDEPKLIRRYVIDYPKFVVFFIYDLLKHRSVE